MTDAVTVATVVPPAVTLMLGWVLGLALYATGGDDPGDFLSDTVVPQALLVAALAAPLALLLAWGEVDLSALGMLPFAGHIYAEAGGGNVAVGVLAATAAGLAIGAAVGLARWLTRVPSAVLSLAVGFVLQAFAQRFLDSGAVRAIHDGFVDDPGLPALVALGYVGVTVAVAVMLGRPSGGAGCVGVGTAAGSPGGRVVVGFAVSGAAAGAVGALNTGMVRAVSANGLALLLTVLCAVAIGGVVRGNWLVGPLAAAAGAGAAELLAVSAVVRPWRNTSEQLLVASVLGACLLVSHGLNRLVVTGRQMGAVPPPPAAWPPPPGAWDPRVGAPAPSPAPTVGPQHRAPPSPVAERPPTPPLPDGGD